MGLWPCWLGRALSYTARGLLAGLPPVVHSPVALLRSRLERKMPPAPPVPVPRQESVSRSKSIPSLRGGAAVAAAGAARVRAVLRAVKTATMPHGGVVGPAFAAAGV